MRLIAQLRLGYEVHLQLLLIPLTIILRILCDAMTFGTG